LFHFHPIPRAILATVIGLYSASTFDFSRIISIASTATLIGIVATLIWNVALSRGKTLQQSMASSSNIPADILRKLVEAAAKMDVYLKLLHKEFKKD
jgi:energy-converting hydrogenase Eha subunit A